MTQDEIDRREWNLLLSDERAREQGTPPLDRSRIAPNCTIEKLCSPYMRQPWGHDCKCPAGGAKGIMGRGITDD